jgi:hypothetical protein
LPDDKQDWYFGVHPTDEVPENAGHSRSRKDTVSAINCLFGEFDEKDWQSAGECRAHVASLKPTPSVIVRSGGGLHVYWLLDKPFKLSNDDDRERADHVQKAWVALVKSDPGAKDLARVLRVPGTSNFKYDPSRPVEIRYPANGTEFALHKFEDLEKLATGAVLKPSSLARPDDAIGQIPEGKRNAALHSLAGTFRKRGMPRDEILHSLRYTNANRCVPPLDDAELVTIANSAAGYPATLPAEEFPIAPKEPKTIHYVDALRALGWEFKLNEMNDDIEVNGAPLTDPIRALVRCQLRDLGYNKTNVAEDAWIATAYENRYHPIRQYLNGLVWDETDTIDLLVGYFKDKHDVFGLWLRRWLIGAVARVMLNGVQNRVLVMDGKQNLGKSYFVRWLASPLPQFHVEGPISTEDKDAAIRAVSNWIWEVSEIGSTIRKSDREALKFFISQEFVTVRRPYGHYDIHKPACCSYIGTINNVSGFLSDPTGSRRYMATTITDIDWDYARKVNINQVWAQATALFKLGEPWDLDARENEWAAAINATYEVTDAVLDYIEWDYVISSDDQDSFTPSVQLLEVLKQRGVRMGTDRSAMMAISDALRSCGIQAVRREVNGKQQRGFIGVRPRSSSDDPEVPL